MNDLPGFYLGPPLEKGPLPAVFYLAISAQDSLTLDPFNQPVKKWLDYPLRIFSLTLPGHEPPRPPQEALQLWAQHLEKGEDLIGAFVDQLVQMTHSLIEKGWIDPKKIGLAGLSRGGFLATHAAARSPLFSTILGFAPLTSLRSCKEFSHLHHLSYIDTLDLHHLYGQLINKKLRFYIGNHDERVETRRCYTFIEGLAETSYAQRIRSPQVELSIFPSIGHQGHGTPPYIFEQGAAWLADQLGVSNDP